MDTYQFLRDELAGYGQSIEEAENLQSVLLYHYLIHEIIEYRELKLIK